MTATALVVLLGVAVASPSRTPTPTPTPTTSPTANPPASGSPAVAKWSEQIVVSATRSESRLGDAPASVTVMTAEDLGSVAAIALDDGLRQVPGFSLFRRTGSRFANPTAQGVSLRGVGASGASRAIVLYDGVPVADPFGGWIPWSRVPRLSLERVEVARGAGSSLYGTDALGGVVSLVPRPTTDGAAAIDVSWGDSRSAAFAGFFSKRFGNAGAQMALDVFRTDGEYVVDPRERGPADTRAGVDFGTIDAAIETRRGEARLFARGSYFDEDRENGTRLQVNDTRFRQLVLGAEFRLGSGSASARAWAGSQTYRQDFSSVAATRSTETLSRSQRTPARHFGLASQWSRSTGARFSFVGGVDARVVDGETDETVFSASRAASRIEAGGRAAFSGVFAEAAFSPSRRALVALGGRFDQWRHDRGRSVTTALATSVRSERTFSDRSESAVSPRASVLVRPAPGLAVTASAYRGFRAPTLNELYRSFRVGSVVTQANENLGPETAAGVEVGGTVSGWRERFRVRATAFAASVRDPVTNLTLTSTPELVTRRRQNLGRSRTRGFEVETAFSLSTSLAAGLSYALTDAAVASAPGTTLAGRVLPQTPRHAATAFVRYADARGRTLALQARATGSQFDDDLNQLPLARAATADVFASTRLRARIDLFVAVENVFDARVETGRAGVTTIGPPRSVRAGFRARRGL